MTPGGTGMIAAVLRIGLLFGASHAGEQTRKEISEAWNLKLQGSASE